MGAPQGWSPAALKGAQGGTPRPPAHLALGIQRVLHLPPLGALADGTHRAHDCALQGVTTQQSVGGWWQAHMLWPWLSCRAAWRSRQRASQ